MSDENCVIARFDSEQDLATAIEVLEKSGFRADEVSVVRSKAGVRERDTPRTGESETESAPTDKTVGVSTLAGGVLGTALGTATLVGPLLIAGPLAGMAAGAVGGGILSSINRWGVDTDSRSEHEKAIEEGAILLIVSGDSIRVADAHRDLNTTKATSVYKSTRSS